MLQRCDWSPALGSRHIDRFRHAFEEHGVNGRSASERRRISSQHLNIPLCGGEVAHQPQGALRTHRPMGWKIVGDDERAWPRALGLHTDVGS
jgi:hypothetical protein